MTVFLNYFRKLWIISLLLALTSCNKTSFEDYEYESEHLCFTLVKILQNISTREELYKAAPQLKKKFHELVALMIEVETFLKKNPQVIPPTPFFHSYSFPLQEEFERIMKIEGGQDFIEKTQKEALIQFDAFLKEREKRQKVPLK